MMLTTGPLDWPPPWVSAVFLFRANFLLSAPSLGRPRVCLGKSPTIAFSLEPPNHRFLIYPDYNTLAQVNWIAQAGRGIAAARSAKKPKTATRPERDHGGIQGR